MAETSADRVVRLLALVAYLEEHSSVPVAQVAEHFGVTESQVLKDVDTLWVSGTPGYQHNDLIDFSADDRERHILTLVEPQGMGTPLRLGPGEAVALLVALRSLASTSGDEALVASALEKLTVAAGSAARAAHAIDVHTDSSQVREHLSKVRTALQRGTQLHLRYVSASDEVSERTVDPLQILTDSQRYFLHAWCYRAGALRQFRLDRILQCDLLDTPVAPHPDVQLAQSPDPTITPEHDRVTLHLASRARWVAERFPVAQVRDLDDGEFAVDIDVVDTSWLRNLVLALGADVLGVQPPEVAAQFASVAQEALDAYAQELPGAH